MGRRATPEDVHDLAMSLPDVTLGITWGDRPTYLVHGRGFLLRRMPHRTAIDPETGEMYDDLLVVMVADAGEKQALVEDDRLPFFTIPHFEGFNAVLVQESRLGEIDRAELEEIITDAWLAKAPKRLAREFLRGRGLDG